MSLIRSMKSLTFVQLQIQLQPAHLLYLGNIKGSESKSREVGFFVGIFGKLGLIKGRLLLCKIILNIC